MWYFMHSGKIGSGLLLLLVFCSCRPEMKLPAGFEAAVEKIRSTFAPDSRTRVFDVVCSRGKNQWLIRAETTRAGGQTCAGFSDQRIL